MGEPLGVDDIHRSEVTPDVMPDVSLIGGAAGLVREIVAALGAGDVMLGADMAPWSEDWTKEHRWTPLCVARPRDTAGVSAVLRLAHAAGVPVVPVSGGTGVSGGIRAEGAVMLSTDHLDQIEEIRPDARLVRVGAGVILEHLHAAVAEHGLSFPMTFGAKGSARIGGLLATNAGGSNVLRYGNTRDLTLGLEAVLADGRVVDLMSELHKNNTGYDLRHLLIGSEGTLAVITRAVLKLVPQPQAHATAMVAIKSLPAALQLLNRVQEMTGGAVEAIEYMPRAYMEAYARLHPEGRVPFAEPHEVNVLLELGATAPRDVTAGADGVVPLTAHLEEALGALFEEGYIEDAVVATTEAQRREFWAIREAAAEVSLSQRPLVLCDIAVAVDRIAYFLEEAQARVSKIDPEAQPVLVAHLGDGNLHYVLWIKDAALIKPLTEAVEEVVMALHGSFSAEHGVGTAKIGSMARRKDPVALDMMRAIKQALDPKGILNPGKVMPPV